MSTAYKITDQGACYYLTFQIVDWVDLFTRQIYRDIVIECLKHCQQKKGLEIYAYVIMSNHIHILCRSTCDNLSGTIRDFKSFSSKQFLKILHTNKESRRAWMSMVFRYNAENKLAQNYQIWTHENHAEIIYSQKFLEQKITYIHNNPVKASIVSLPENYLYSSARNYHDMEGLLDIVKVDFKVKTY